MDDDETVEERTVTREVPESATGVRLRLSLALIVLGITLIGLGVLLTTLPAGARIALVVGGLLLVGGFACVAVGARRIGFAAKGAQAGADLPQGETVRTTIRKRGFPKHGAEPLEKERQMENGRRSGPGSGRGG